MCTVPGCAAVPSGSDEMYHGLVKPGRLECTSVAMCAIYLGWNQILCSLESPCQNALQHWHHRCVVIV